MKEKPRKLVGKDWMLYIKNPNSTKIIGGSFEIKKPINKILSDFGHIELHKN